MTRKRSPLPKVTIERLLRSAHSARKHAHCPYSEFAVGAAIIAASGKIYKGVNVENASFGATICAERTAITAAVSAGEREFTAIAVVADGEKPPTPCGACLQVMAEFCKPDLPILLQTATAPKVTKRFRLSELLPETFTLNRDS